MEPLHLLRCPLSLRPRLEEILASRGIEVEWDGRSSLVSNPDCNEITCRRGIQVSWFAVGPDRESGDHFVLVYLNRLDDELTREIRNHLESLGAEWDYWLP